MLILANIMLDLTLNLEAYQNSVTVLCFQGLPPLGKNITDSPADTELLKYANFTLSNKKRSVIYSGPHCEGVEWRWSSGNRRQPTGFRIKFTYGYLNNVKKKTTKHFHIEIFAKKSTNQKETNSLGPSRSWSECCSLSLSTVSYMDLMNLGGSWSLPCADEGANPKASTYTAPRQCTRTKGHQLAPSI